MKDIRLPVIKEHTPPADRILSMEEYLQFVQFNLENFFDKEFYLQWKETIAVDVPFKLK